MFLLMVGVLVVDEVHMVGEKGGRGGLSFIKGIGPPPPGQRSKVCSGTEVTTL